MVVDQRTDKAAFVAGTGVEDQHDLVAGLLNLNIVTMTLQILPMDEASAMQYPVANGTVQVKL